jgi:transposase
MNNNKNNPKIESITIENSNENLNYKCAKLEQEIEQLQIKLNWYEEQFRLSKHKQFGKSSEQTHPDQLSLLNEAEAEADPSVKDPTVEEITYKRRKKKGNNNRILENLPVEVIEYKLSEDELECPACNGPLHEMSKEIRKELKIIPAQVKVVEHVRYIYTCRRCQKDEPTTPIITSPMPKPILPGSLVSPSVMAFVMNKKYVEAVPLYRQEQQWKNYGIDLSRQTLSNWMIQGANKWLIHLYNRLHDHLLNEEVLHGDETTLQVLREDGRSADTKSYMWMFATGRDSRPIYLYNYQTTRASKHPKKFLNGFKGYLHTDGYAGFKGYLHTDGYAGYNDIPEVRISGCFAHARRKFTDCLKALPKDASTIKTTAEEGLNYCNRGERAIKTFVMGRKNWMFSNTPKGATASATIYR